MAAATAAPGGGAPSGKRLVIAVDQGTTSTRAIAFDHAGAIVGRGQMEHQNFFPASGWVEHDAAEIWANVNACIAGALTGARATPADVAALGITVQRETVVVWDAATGEPLYRALVWQDQRGAPLCEALAAGDPAGRDRFRGATGLPLVPYFSASKLAWLLDNVPGLRARAEAGTALAGTVDAYLTWRLTGGGVHATDVSNASRTLLMNIHSLAWDPALCDAFAVPQRMLPSIVPSSGVVGECGRHTPLPGVPVAGLLGDQQAALFGQTCFAPGDAKNTYGTGCFLLMNTGGAPVTSRAGLLSTVAYQLAGSPPVYALEGSVAVAGAVVTWLRDNLQAIDSAGQVEALAASVPDNGDVYFVPAFNGLFAPHWHSEARGLLIGLSGHTRKGHIVRAALESVAYQSKELLDAMQADADAAFGKAATGQALRVDGGMTANDALMQFQADVTGRTVVRPVVAETTALGAAYAAGLGVGFWKDLGELKAQWKRSKEWEPRMPKEQVAGLLSRWDNAVKRTYNWKATAAPAVPLAATAAAATVPNAATAAAARGAKAARAASGGAGGSLTMRAAGGALLGLGAMMGLIMAYRSSFPAAPKSDKRRGTSTVA